MPSLTSAKTEQFVTTDASEYAKSMVTMMEKRIRNLEKRKTKLEDYQDKQKKGETLTDEQKKAVAKFMEVTSQIELLQELIKHCSSSSTETEKQRKKLEKRQKFEQAENEKKRLTDVLQLQRILGVITNEELRQALMESLSGTKTLEQQELDNLSNFFKLVNPDRNVQESLNDQMRKVAEHLQAFLDDRDKPVCGTTYHNIHDLIDQVKHSPYFTQAKNQEATEDNDASTEKEFIVVKSEEVPHPDSEEVRLALPPEIIPEQEVSSITEQLYQQHIDNTYSHPHQLHQPEQKTLQQIVGTVQGTFNFIQDSEIDVESPSHVDPAVLSVHQIPAQYHQQIVPQQSAGNAVAGTYLVIENSMYHQQPSFQPYVPSGHHQSVPYHQHNVPQQHPAQTESDIQSDANEAVPEDHYDDEGYQQTTSSGGQENFEQRQTDEFSQHSGGNMRNDNRGGYRGRRGVPHSNGYGQRGNYRGGYERGPYRGDRTGGNGYHDGRRGGRGGHRGGFRGQSSGRGGPSDRGNQRYRGQSHQQVSQPAQQAE